MEDIVHTMIDHPLATLAICFIVLLVIYFIFKSLIKLALVLIFIALLVVGYRYIQNPEFRPEEFREAVQKARSGAAIAVDKGKDALQEAKKLIEEGKNAYDRGRILLDREKAALNRGAEKKKDAAKKDGKPAGDADESFDTDGNREKRLKP